MIANFTVPTPLKTAILANAHAQRMAEDTAQALRNSGIKAHVEVVLTDKTDRVVANIEVNAGSGVKRTEIEKVINLMYG